MKKICMLLLISFLCSCIEAGKFPEKRQKLHNMNTGQEEGFCTQNPHRCIDGVAW